MKRCESKNRSTQFCTQASSPLSNLLPPNLGPMHFLKHLPLGEYDDAGTYRHVCEYLTLVFGVPTWKDTLLQFGFLRFLFNHFLKFEFGCWIEVLKLCQCLCRIQGIHLVWQCMLNSNQ